MAAPDSDSNSGDLLGHFYICRNDIHSYVAPWSIGPCKNKIAAIYVLGECMPHVYIAISSGYVL